MPKKSRAVKTNIAISELPQSAPSCVCFLCALQESGSGTVINRHMTCPTWALFKLEEKEMWPLQIICGILQLALSFASVVLISICWLLKTGSRRHRWIVLADITDTFSLCHGWNSQSPWAQALQDSCLSQCTPDLSHLKSLWKIILSVFSFLCWM